MQQQRLAQKIECGGIDIRVQALSPGNRKAKEGHVALTVLTAIVNVGAVDRESGDGLAQDRLENIVGEIARLPIGGGDPAEQVGKHINFTGQCGLHHLELASVNDLVRVGRVPENLGIESVESLFVGALDKDAVGEVDKVVAGGAANRPLRRQVFARLEDFLDHGVKRSLALRPVVSANRIENAALDPVGGGLLLWRLARRIGWQGTKAATGSGTGGD